MVDIADILVKSNVKKTVRRLQVKCQIVRILQVKCWQNVEASGSSSSSREASLPHVFFLHWHINVCTTYSV